VKREKAKTILKWFIPVTIIILILIVIIIKQYREKQEIKAQNVKYVVSAFFVDGEAYCVAGNEKNNFSRKFDNYTEYYELPDGKTMTWCESRECFYYCDGTKLYTCSLDGKNSERIWTAPDVRSIKIAFITDDWVVINARFTSGGLIYSMPIGASSRASYALNLESGDVTELSGRSGLEVSPNYFAGEGGTFFYYTENGDIGRTDLEAGNVTDTRLCSVSGLERVEFGCIMGGYGFFCDYDFIYRVAVEGGEDGKAELLKLSLPDNMRYFEALTSSESDIIIALSDSRNYSTYTLCTLNPDTLEIKKIPNQAEIISVRGLIADSSRYYVWSGEYTLSGEIYENRG